jgi:LuxR family transcriptional regulator, maltose regulon positive regulatory protein
MELILEKTTIPSQLPRLGRPRLLARLRSSLESCTSTVISGRAGAGKTALATDFARICGRPVAWYKVDASDSDLRVFFAYLVSSIQQQRPGFNEHSIMSLVGSAKADHILRLAETIVYELLEGEGNPLLIAIEDLHQVCDAEWLVPFLCRFLPLLPRDVHVLITSRTLPPAPLWRMRSKQTLEVIDEATLAFTREEAVELFATHGLSGEHAQVAFEHTHGRAAALATHAVTLNKSLTVHESRLNKAVPPRLVDQKGEPCHWWAHFI